MKCKIAIVTAVYNPNIQYLKEQIESYQNQTCNDFYVVFVASDLKSNAIIKKIASNYSFSFTILTPDKPLGPREAFGYGITEVISKRKAVEYIALSDQDDIWLPHKLENLLSKAELSNASLVHSNAVVVDQFANVLKSSYWKRSYWDQTSFTLLCFRNSVIGMTSLFTIETATLAVPFLENSNVEPLHDWMLAIAAGAIGRIEYIDNGLVLYRQHDNNVIGWEDRNVITQLIQTPRKIISAWIWARTTQPIILSTLRAYENRSRALNIQNTNGPLSFTLNNGTLYALIWYFFRKRSLHGFFSVILHILKHRRYTH
jgi:glycosyltransferase involved in cell wall biosynthesis